MTDEQHLHMCNLVSRGMSLSKAREKALGKVEEKPAIEDGEKKLTAQEKKDLLREEIEALGGVAPDNVASVAKFEEALTAAKFIKEDAEAKAAEAEAEEKQKVADKAKKKAKRERAEADDLL